MSVVFAGSKDLSIIAVTDERRFCTNNQSSCLMCFGECPVRLHIFSRLRWMQQRLISLQRHDRIQTSSALNMLFQLAWKWWAQTYLYHKKIMLYSCRTIVSTTKIQAFKSFLQMFFSCCEHGMWPMRQCCYKELTFVKQMCQMHSSGSQLHEITFFCEKREIFGFSVVR